MVILEVVFFPVPVSMLHYFSLKVPCYCLDTSKLRSPQLGSHWVLNCLSCSPGNLVGRRTEGSFPKKVKGSQLLHIFFPLNKQCIDNYCAFSCLRLSKEDILEAEKLLRDLSNFQFVISHGCFGSCFLHGFFSKKALILVSERSDSNGVFSLRSDRLHTTESMAILGVLLVLGGSYQCHWENGSEKKWEKTFYF